MPYFITKYNMKSSLMPAFLFIVLINFAAGSCASYSDPVLIENNYKMKFYKTLIYEGTVIKPGLYHQAETTGNIKTGLINSAAENIRSLNLFRKVIIRKKNTFGKINPDENSLIMRTSTNLIRIKSCGEFLNDGCAEMRMSVIIFKPDRKNVVYHKTYYINKVFIGSKSEVAHYEIILIKIMSRVLKDIRKGDFNNPDYMDIHYKDIIIK